MRTKEVSVNFTEGQSNKLNKFLAAKLELLENASLVNQGTPKKRFGHNALVAGPDFCHRLDTYDEQLLEWGKDGLYSYSPANTSWRRTSTGPSADLSKQVLYCPQGTVRMADQAAATLGNFEVVTFVSANGPEVRLRDLVSGADVYVFFHGSGGRIRPAIFGGNLGYVYCDSSGDVTYYKLTPGTPVVSTGTLLETGAHEFFDVCACGTSLALVTYDAALASIRVKVFNSALTQTASFTASSAFAVQFGAALSLYWDTFNSYLWIGNAQVNATPACVFYTTAYTLSGVQTKAPLAIYTLASTASDAAMNICMATADGATLHVFYDYHIPAGNRADMAVVNIAANTLTSTAIFMLDGCLISNPWIYNSKPTVWVARTITNPLSDQINSAYYAMNSDRDVVARTLRGRADVNNPGVTTYYDFIARPEVSGAVISSILKELDIVGDSQGRILNARYTAAKIILDYEALTGAEPVKMGNSLYYGGANPMTFDGSLYETGFHYGPYLSGSLGAGSIPAGTYVYKAVYEFFNSKGELVLALPSQDLEITFAGPNQNVTLSVWNYTFGKLASVNVRIAIYRTISGGDVLYRLTDVANAPSSQKQSVVDSTTDSTLAQNDTWYFPGDVLENSPPDPISGYTIFKNRLMSVSADRENYLQFSKEKDFNLEAGHNEFLRTVLEDSIYSNGDNLQCTGVIDDKVILFKDSSTYFMIGDGPNNAGEGDFSRPQLITSDVGCTNPRSIISTPMGLFFMSQKGFYLITRGMELVYIGADVENFNGEQITGAVIIEDNDQVVFSTASGPLLVYDYEFRQWSIYQNYSANDIAFWDGKLVHGKSTGVVHKETTGYTDDGAFIPMKIQTNWLKIGDMQDFGRVRRSLFLGEYKSPHQFKVSVSYDYEQYAWDAYTLTPQAAANYNVTVKPTLASQYTGTVDGVYQWQIHLAKQKCQALKFLIEDIAPDSPEVPGESFTLTNMTLEAGLKDGPFKTVAAKQR